MDRVIVSLALFVVLYLSALMGLIWSRLLSFHWAALMAVVIATAGTVGLRDRGQWPLGFFVNPRRLTKELLYGLAFATVLIGVADLLIVMTTGMRHTRGLGFPYGQLLAVFIPAVFHEELLFRGYPFQRLFRLWPRAAIVGCSAAFAALHLWNDYITPLAILNIFLGGLLLSLAYARYQRLWFPIGVHLAWNLMSGPILGYSVSGFGPETTVLRVVGTGNPLLTGGLFGIEGSVWMTIVEGVGVWVLGVRWLATALESRQVAAATDTSAEIQNLPLR